MFGITDLWAYVLGTVLIILVPGPNSLFALTMASTKGRQAGFAAAAGIVVGDLILMLTASFGVASLMKANPIAFDIVRYLGAGYLAYIGLRAILSKPQQDTQELTPVENSARKAFRSALGISLVNVKAILFFMAFFPQFVNPNYPHVWHTFAALGLIVQFVSISYLTVLILVGSSLSRRLSAKIWLKNALNKLVGTLFVSFGLRLALN